MYVTKVGTSILAYVLSAEISAISFFSPNSAKIGMSCVANEKIPSPIICQHFGMVVGTPKKKVRRLI